MTVFGQTGNGERFCRPQVVFSLDNRSSLFNCQKLHFAFKNDVTSPCSAFFSNGIISFRPEMVLFSNFGVKHSYGVTKDVTSRRDRQYGE